MLVTKLETAEKNDYLIQRFRKAYAFLREADVANLPLGRVGIEGDDVFANVQEYETVPATEKELEAHRQYFDVQFVVSGEESFYYAPLEGLEEAAPFDEASDFGLYKTPAACSEIRMEAGDVVVVAPEDAHKPGCVGNAPCQVRKVVVKVRA
ncbi:MAG: YhcH/YjgK/YiaL family protein [Raoultibacter sp.]